MNKIHFNILFIFFLMLLFSCNGFNSIEGTYIPVKGYKGLSKAIIQKTGEGKIRLSFWANKGYGFCGRDLRCKPILCIFNKKKNTYIGWKGWISIKPNNDNTINFSIITKTTIMKKID